MAVSVSSFESMTAILFDLLAAVRRWQILQAKGLTTLLRTERDAIGNGTAKQLRKAFLITRLQREVTVVHIARQQPLELRRAKPALAGVMP
jgi:hypothetical protein